MTVTLVSHFYHMKGVVKLESQRSELVKIMFVQTLTLLWMYRFYNNLAQMFPLMRTSVTQRNLIETI